MTAIPHELNAFIVWLRDVTEELWSTYQTRDFEAECVGGSDWQNGTRWLQGLSVEQVLAIEQRWEVKFPEDYRLFLRCIHSTDRPMIEAGFGQDGELEFGTGPGFYNWLLDSENLEAAFQWPLNGLMFDVEHNDLWLASWGPRPDTLASCRSKLADLISEAPPLIPLIGHRYLVGRPLRAGNPVLSVYQGDIIFYGSDLRSFLLLELADVLGHPEDSTNASPDPGSIPFWGEIMQLA